MHLYEIPLEAQQIDELLSESEGELTPEIEARLSEFLAGGAEKLENAACVVRSLQAQSDACREEIARLKARQTSLEVSIERLKALMLEAVDRGFKGKLKTSLFTIWGQNSKATVSFSLCPDMDPWLVPEEFVLTPPPELDKARLQQMVKDGRSGEIPVCILKEEKPGTRFLQIR